MKQKLRAFNKDTLALALLSLIGVATHLPWFFTFKHFTSGDWWFIGLERYKDFLQFSPIWVSNNLGGMSATPHFYVVRYLEALTTTLGATFALNQKLFFFLPIVLVSLWGSYALLRMYFTARFAFLGALVYGFNTIFLFNQVGALTIEVVYALAPVSVYLFKRLLEAPKNGRLIVASAFLLSVMVFYELRISLLVIGTLFGLLLFNTLFREGRWRYLWPRAFSFGAVLTGVLLINSFWILPTVFNTGSSAMAELAGRGLFVSFSDVLNGLTLHHPFWTGERPTTFVSQPIPVYAWLVPIVAFAGFVIRPLKAHKEIYFWGLLTLGGIFLVKQVNEPFLMAYPWLYEHIPGFGAFRESSKFYLFITLSYAVLIPFSVGRIEETLAARAASAKKNLLGYGKYAVYALACGLFLWNAAPLVNGTFRTLMLPHDMPGDYTKLNAFIDSQRDYFRTLWVPVNSRWATDTNRHPNLIATQLTQGQWLSQLGDDPDIEKPTLRDKVASMLANPSTKDFLALSSVKYVVVPLRDLESEDDFFKYYGDDRQFYLDKLNAIPYLRPVDLGLSEVAVYENTSAAPYISASSDMHLFTSLARLSDNYDFVTKGLGEQFTFASTTKDQPAFPAKTVVPLFQEAKTSPLGQDVPALAKPLVYIRSSGDMEYTLQKGKLTLYAKDQDQLLVNNNPVRNTAPLQQLGVAQLPTDTPAYLQIGGQLSEIQKADTTRKLGVVSEPLTIYSAEKKQLVPNASFDHALWQDRVADCNNYDNAPQINMQRVTDQLSGSSVLELKANRHTACTETTAENPSTQPFLFSLDYRVEVGDKAAFEIVFNDTAKTTVKKELSATAKWRTFRQIMVPPAGATAFTVRLLGYPEYQMRSYATSYYDNVQAVALRPLLKTNASPSYRPYDLPPSLPLHFSYKTTGQGPNTNLIPNGSFEDKLWQDRVGDCNQYDDRPVIGMKRVNGATPGSKALQLEARRHAACTQTNRIKVQENNTYLFSFDYQSPNAKRASYYIAFNDPAHTVIKGDVAIKNRNWATFTRQIKAPLDATEAALVLYAYSDEYEQLTIINRYDNVVLTHVPDTQNRFYLVNRPERELARPASVTFDAPSATKKHIHIKGAGTSFYLAMGEAYHPAWKLSAGNVAVSQQHHYKLGDVMNGWYIDADALCATPGICKNNSDGTYDIELVAEFGLQKWVGTGLLIGGGTVATGMVYSLISWGRQLRRRQQKRRQKVPLYTDKPDGTHFVVRAPQNVHVPPRTQQPKIPKRPGRKVVQL
ncbi:MAG TPA: hypothetical protein VLA88_05420 [Candidatus Saccharimonadales bacterium]|nr:hypothetical protein [Candidatus Saccharimonadales bacterium]